MTYNAFKDKRDVDIFSGIQHENNRLKSENETMKLGIALDSDFKEWLVDIYLNDGTTLSELYNEFEKYLASQETNLP